MSRARKGFPPPNYTQAPNVLLDRLLPEIETLAELKVTLAVVRHTLGYHRESAGLSINGLIAITGLARRSVIDGTTRAIERGTIAREEAGTGWSYFLAISEDSGSADSALGGSADIAPPGSADSALEVVQDLHPSLIEGKKGLKKTPYKSPTGDSCSDEFSEWLVDYHDVTGRTQVKGSVTARSFFRGRRREGHSVEDLKLATRGCRSNPFNVENHHDVPETILRAANVTKYIEAGRALRPTDDGYDDEMVVSR